MSLMLQKQQQPLDKPLSRIHPTIEVQEQALVERAIEIGLQGNYIFLDNFVDA